VLAVPSDKAVLQAVGLARGMNPKMRIIARLRFISSGMEAHRRGADEVIVEEQVVAAEMTRLLESADLLASNAAGDSKSATTHARECS
jgi:voltage-gated potassium channel Kch